MHDAARTHYERLSADGTALYTTSYIVDETATRLRYDLGLDTALRFREVLRSAETKRRLRIFWVDRRLEERAWDVLERYASVPLSMTDAVTIAVARSQRISELFSFDDDFGAAGLTVLPDRPR